MHAVTSLQSMHVASYCGSARVCLLPASTARVCYVHVCNRVCLPTLLSPVLWWHPGPYCPHWQHCDQTCMIASLYCSPLHCHCLGVWSVRVCEVWGCVKCEDEDVWSVRVCEVWGCVKCEDVWSVRTRVCEVWGCVKCEDVWGCVKCEGVRASRKATVRNAMHQKITCIKKLRPVSSTTYVRNFY